MSGLYSDVGPFSILPEWIADHEKAGLSHGAVRLFALLARYADRDGEGAFPARRTLAKRLGLSRPESVVPLYKELVNVGAVTVEPRYGPGGAQTSNAYQLHFVAPPPCAVPHGEGVRSTARPPCAQPHAKNENPSTEKPLSPTEPVADGRDFVAHFVDEVKRVTGTEPMRTMLGRLGRESKRLLGEGVPEDTISAAITVVAERGLSVGALPGVAESLTRSTLPIQRLARGTVGMSAADIAAMASELEGAGL